MIWLSLESGMEPANIAADTPRSEILRPEEFERPPEPLSCTALPETFPLLVMVDNFPSPMLPASLSALMEPANFAFVTPESFSRSASELISIEESSTLTERVSPAEDKPFPAVTCPRPLKRTYVTASEPRLEIVAVCTKAWSE